jgi:hypothetical protein
MWTLGLQSNSIQNSLNGCVIYKFNLVRGENNIIQ